MSRYFLTSNPVAIFVVISIDTNNPQGMQLRRFKNRTPADYSFFFLLFFSTLEYVPFKFHVSAVSHIVMIDVQKPLCFIFN